MFQQKSKNSFLILLREIVPLIKSCTEIEWYKVEGNSIGIMIMWKRWIDNLVILSHEIPDFSFQSTEDDIS